MTAGRTNHTKFAAASGAFVTDVDGKRHWWAKGEPFPDCKLLGGISDAEAVQLWHDVIRSDVRPSPLLIARYAQCLTERLQESRVLYADEPISEQSYTPTRRCICKSRGEQILGHRFGCPLRYAGPEGGQ